MRQDRRETESVCEHLLCNYGCKWPSLHTLFLPCSYKIVLGDAICELIDLCWSGVYMHGVRRFEEFFFLLQVDASVSESNSCESE